MFSALQSWLPRFLLLLAVWGISVFLWSTFDAWARDQQTDSERVILSGQIAGARRWLDTAIAPLDRFATDPRLRIGLDLPDGVNSLPVQRVMYEFAYLTGQPTVYLVELNQKKVGQTAGAAELAPEILARLEQLQLGDTFLIGLGQRNGVVMLGRRVDAPLPQQVVALLPLTLGQFAAASTPVRLPAGRKLGLVIPHTAGWAWWEDGSLKFDIQTPLVKAVAAREDTVATGDGLSVLAPIPGWPNVVMSLSGPAAHTPLAMLPHILVGIWAIVMSLLVLWGPSLVLRHKVAERLKPVAGPVRGGMGKLSGMFSHALGAIRTKLDTLAGEDGGDTKLTFADDHLTRLDLDELRESRRVSGRRMPGDRPGRKHTAEEEEAARLEAVLNAQRERAKHVPKPTDNSPLPAASIKDLIAECLRENRIRLLYQTVYRISDNIPVMHEVFARLVTAEGRVMQPNEFLPVATEHRMMLDLDLAVFRKVMDEHFANGGIPLTPLALNISSTSLDGISYLQEMANQGPRVLQKLAFEVRSQEMIKDPKAMRLLKDLQKHGGNLAVDYFGGGIAMLEASKTMGFNYVKMDCNRFSASDETKKELIMLCRKAQSLDLPVIMEKVSSHALEVFSRKVGASFMQGYALNIPKTELSIEPLRPGISSVAASVGENKTPPTS